MIDATSLGLAARRQIDTVNRRPRTAPLSPLRHTHPPHNKNSNHNGQDDGTCNDCYSCRWLSMSIIGVSDLPTHPPTTRDDEHLTDFLTDAEPLNQSEEPRTSCINDDTIRLPPQLVRRLLLVDNFQKEDRRKDPPPDHPSPLLFFNNTNNSNSDAHIHHISLLGGLFLPAARLTPRALLGFQLPPPSTTTSRAQPLPPRQLH